MLIEDIAIEQGSLNITMYRDDLYTGLEKPILESVIYLFPLKIKISSSLMMFFLQVEQ